MADPPSYPQEPIQPGAPKTPENDPGSTPSTPTAMPYPVSTQGTPPAEDERPILENNMPTEKVTVSTQGTPPAEDERLILDNNMPTEKVTGNSSDPRLRNLANADVPWSFTRLVALHQGRRRVTTDIESPDRGVFSDKKIRLAFVRKVYAILMMQLVIMTAMIALFLYVPNVVQFSRENPYLLWVSLATPLLITLIMVAIDMCRWQWPMNFILLIIFTLCEGWALGEVCSYYETKIVLMAAGICAMICLLLIFFAFQPVWDFTACGSILLVFFSIFALFCVSAQFYEDHISQNQIACSCLGALLFSLFLIYDTQMILGGKQWNAVSPEDYIFASLTLYVDIIQLFLEILAACGGADGGE